jgi:hypothetical protein
MLLFWAAKIVLQHVPPQSPHNHDPGPVRCGCQNIVMQALRRGCEPRAEAVLCPVCRSEQNNAGALHEERAQIAVSALCNAAEDRAITGRHLIRCQAEPRGEVTSFRKALPLLRRVICG